LSESENGNGSYESIPGSGNETFRIWKNENRWTCRDLGYENDYDCGCDYDDLCGASSQSFSHKSQWNLMKMMTTKRKTKRSYRNDDGEGKPSGEFSYVAFYFYIHR
jgi:hypothetical protein